MKVVYCFCLLSLISYLLSPISHAVELRSPRFRMDIDKIEFGTNDKVSSKYSLNTRFGNQAADLALQGFALKAGNTDEISFSINPALTTFTKTHTHGAVDLTYSFPSGFQIGLIQEYSLKNTDGEAVENSIYYSREGKFLPIPNENKGNFPATLIFSKGPMIDKKSQLKLRLNPQSIETKRMYETVVNFIALPGY